MNIESLIKNEAIKLKSSRRDIEIAPDINQNSLEKWMRKYACFVDGNIKDYILVMSYTSTGSFVLTGNAMYVDNFLQNGLVKIGYDEIVSVTSKTGGLFSVDKIIINKSDGKEILLDGCIDGINIDFFARMLLYISGKAKEENLSISKQGVMSYELSETLKIIYLKILCNYAYLNGENIEHDEYNLISKYSIRMEVDTKSRDEIRRYMNSIKNREKTGKLFQCVKQIVKEDSGKWDAFRYCIMQDALAMHNIKNRGKLWQEDGFIGSLMEVCKLCPKQIDTMLEAVILNEQMQKKGADLIRLKKKWTDLQNRIRYTSGYVPGQYLFCAGSIYGKDVYKSFILRTYTSENEINKQRELILHDIITNNQKTMNVLIDDMNYLAEEVNEAINESDNLKKVLYKLLEKLKALQGVKDDIQEEQEEFDECKENQKMIQNDNYSGYNVTE